MKIKIFLLILRNLFADLLTDGEWSRLHGDLPANYKRVQTDQEVRFI